MEELSFKIQFNEDIHGNFGWKFRLESFVWKFRLEDRQTDRPTDRPTDRQSDLLKLLAGA